MSSQKRALTFFKFWYLIGWCLIFIVITLSLMPSPPDPIDLDMSDKLYHLLAYGGLMEAIKEGSPTSKIDGFTQQQRFFLSWARVWRNNITKENLIMRVKTDPHSPGKFRTIGPLTNMEIFYKAFDVKKGDTLYKENKDRIKIW